MTELLITPNYDKKTAKFKGTVAAGETVRVKIVNARDIDIYSLRLRVMEFNGRTLALFERTFPVEEDGAEINWVNDGEHLTCNLDLNTVEMQSAVCGMCERELLVVLDDPENDILHFKSICAFQGWPKMKGKDAPYELGEYPDVVEDLKQRVANAEMSIAASVDKASGIVAQANNVKNIAEKAQMNAAGSATNAVAAKNEAAGYAEEAAMSAKGLQTAVKSAEEHKNAAETARDEAEKAKNAAENARDNAETVAEESAQKLVAAEKSRAEMAENEIRGKVATLIASDTDKSARSIAAEEVAKIVTGAPDDLDTLKEIAAYIESDKTGAAAMVAKISENSNEITLLNEGKVNKESGKGLSTNDYTDAEKTKLEKIEEGAQKNPDLTPYAKKTDLKGFVSVKEAQSFTDDEKEMASVNGGYRYRLYAPKAEDETIGDTEYLKYSVKDYAINVILLDTAKPVRIHLPAPVDTTGRCRDFIVKLKVTSEALPSVEFVKSDADESIAFESSDEDWATLEAGINYFTFTETECVA